MAKVVIPAAVLPSLPRDVCASSGSLADGTIRVNVARAMPWWYAPLALVPGGVLVLIVLSLSGGQRFDLPVARHTRTLRLVGVGGLAVASLVLPLAVVLAFASRGPATLGSAAVTAAVLAVAARVYHANSVGVSSRTDGRVLLDRLHPKYAEAVLAVANRADDVRIPAQREPERVPAGWYPDPGGSEALRWWDGAAWTTHVHPVASPT